MQQIHVLQESPTTIVLVLYCTCMLYTHTQALLLLVIIISSIIVPYWLQNIEIQRVQLKLLGENKCWTVLISVVPVCLMCFFPSCS